MLSGDSYTLLLSIMTDELKHASKYNFLIYNAKQIIVITKINRVDNELEIINSLSYNKESDL